MNNEISALINLLGSDNIEDIKKRIANIIVEQCENDLHSYSEYLLYPPEMQCLVKDAMESCQKKVEKMYKDAVIDINKKYIEDLKEYADRTDHELRQKLYDYAKELSWKGNKYSKEHEIAKELFGLLKIDEPINKLEE